MENACALRTSTCMGGRKIKGVYPLPKNSVSEVIFGARMSEEEIKIICQIIRQLPECEHIRLQWTKLHESRYELVLEDIPPSFWVERWATKAGG